MEMSKDCSQTSENYSILSTAGIGKSQSKNQIRIERNMHTKNVLGYSKLALHLNNPDLDDVWLEGFEAASSLQDETSNPYQKDNSEHEYWSQGWWAGFYGEAPLFEKEQVTDNCQEELSTEHSLAWRCMQYAQTAIEKVAPMGFASFAIYEILPNIS